MRLGIVSDGTVRGTSVLADGKPLKNVQSIRWEMSVGEPFATVTMEVRRVRVDLVGKLAESSDA